ncbi:MAG: HD domain-containing protein [Lachnospiraceae bacterium]|nr:HD domain-containing protein [Lachnospiraceae bacterium]
MKFGQHKINKNTLIRFAAVTIGVALNVLLSYLSYAIDLPVYWDTIGTIVVACMAGMFPAISVAVLTNVICGAFNEYSLYFGVVHVVIAALAVWLIRKKPFKMVWNIILFILLAAVISSIFSSMIQWAVMGGPQNNSVMVLLETMGFEKGAKQFIVFLGINILFNIFDKGICLGLAFVILHFVPKNIKESIDISRWKQRPLTKEEQEAIENWSNNTKFSARKRILLIMLTMVLGTTVVISWISVTRYYNDLKEDKTQVAINAARLAASVVDTSKVDDYIKYGESVPGYKETEDALYRIRENSNGVNYLYLLKVGREGSTFIFDLDADPKYIKEGEEENLQGYEPGEFVPIEEAFEEHLEDLLSGKEIPPIESDDTWSWLVTAYYPVHDSAGNLVCYAGADVSVDYLTYFVRDYASAVLLIMAGILVLIIVYGIWTTNYYTVYPIETIGVYVREFISAGDDKEKLDEAVKKIKSLDIETNDEVESLYKDIAEMAYNQSEQIQSIRRLSENTVKMQDGLIITMADLVENRDEDTGSHVQKTAAYVEIIAEGLAKKGYYPERVTPQFISDVVRSAPLHDVGKINIPDNVLNKPGKLTDEEFEIMKTHTTAGREIMENAIKTIGGGNYLKEARNMAGYHHERWDGKGYPEGLHGEVIPLSARIMAVADVFDALTSARVYKPAFSFEKALSIIEEGKGTQFDPKCVEAFMDNLARVRVIYKKYNQDV